MGIFDRFRGGRATGTAGGTSPLSEAERRLRHELTDRGTGAVRVSLLFSGAVQGVGFRWTNQALAREAGLTGWVRNLDDGRVEMELQGPAAVAAAHLDEVHRRYGRFGYRVLVDAWDLIPLRDEGEFAVRM